MGFAVPYLYHSIICIIPEIATLNTRVTHTQKGPYRSGLGLIDLLKKSVVSGRGSIDHISLESISYFIVLNQGKKVK